MCPFFTLADMDKVLVDGAQDVQPLVARADRE